jgi:branched-chain amino acid transport system permease protein
LTNSRLALIGAGVAALVIAPVITGEFWTGMLVQILVFGLLALSVDLLLGHTGLFSLCHASFFAVSAYTTAILHVRYEQVTLVAAPAGILAAIILALIFGLAVRTRGVYFILVTIALGYVIWGVTYRWSSFTGGDNGVTNIPYPSIGSLTISSITQYYYLVLIVVALCLLLYHVLVCSPFGLGLRGIKSSESRMRSMGYNVSAHLYSAFVLSGALAGVAGVLYIYYNRFVNPSTAAFPISVEAALMVIIGGSATLIGPFLGSAVILCLRNWVSSFFEQYMAIMGLVFIASVLWMPGGIMGLWHLLLSKLRGDKPPDSSVPQDGDPKSAVKERAA